MNRYPWFRLYAEARTDAKLRTLTDAQFRVWFNLLCYASEQEDRGTIPPMDSFLLAVEVAGGDETLLAETVTRLVALRMIDGGEALTFSKFTERQYDKPSDSPDQTRLRKQKQRAKQRDEGVTTDESRPMSRDVTRGHAPEKRREEERRVEESRSPIAVTEVGGSGGGAPAPRHERAEAAPLRPVPKPKDAPAPKRAPDLLFEAVCEACGIDRHQLTDAERGKVNAAVGQIRKAGGTPEDVPRRAANFDLHFTVTRTPMAFAGNWSLLANPPPIRAAPNRKPTAAENAAAAREMLRQKYGGDNVIEADFVARSR